MAYSFSSFSSKAQKIQDHFGSEMKTLRTGRATVEMLDDVHVEAYGTRMKLVEVASVSAPDASLLLVQPWDKSLVEAIEKGIRVSQPNLSPAVSGDVIRIAIPSLTGEKRQELVKQLHKMLEGTKVMVRNLRTETKQEIEDTGKTDGVSEDVVKADLAQLEENVKKVNTALETLTSKKEQELLKV